MQLDVLQLQQCELQAELFEDLDKRDVDAVKFIDAFLTSKAVEGLDASFDRMQWAGKEYVFQEVMDEAGLGRESHPHRYNTEALYYAGWITRYWHYLTGESSREIHAQRNARELLQSYGYHSVANDLAVENMKADAHKNDCLDNGRTCRSTCSRNDAETDTRWRNCTSGC